MQKINQKNQNESPVENIENNEKSIELADLYRDVANLETEEQEGDDGFPTFIDVRHNWQEIKKTKYGYSNSNLYIKNVPKKGLGVFSKTDIKKGDVIEYCHSIFIETPRPWMRDRGITKYCYWSGDTGLMPLGFGPIYNSAERDFLKNAHYFLFPDDSLIVFVAQRDIPAGEEVLVWWGEDYYKSWCIPNKENKIRIA
jgi:hypothetical protein